MSTIITAILIWVAVTPLVPAARGGHPGPTGPLALPAPGVAVCAADPPATPPPPPVADAAAAAPWPPAAAPAVLAPDASPPDAPDAPPLAARLVAARSLPGRSSHITRARTTSVATPAVTRSALGARRAQKRNSWLGLIVDGHRSGGLGCGPNSRSAPA